MAHPTGESEFGHSLARFSTGVSSWSFTVPTTSDAGLLPFRELDDVMADAVLSDGRR
jgi:hypothetical protein